jgi:hypothetical protein
MDAYTKHAPIKSIEEAYALTDSATAHLSEQIAEFHAAVNADIRRRNAEA